MEPVAIVGIACRFPGANGPAEFWRLLRDGVDAIGEVPPDRWDLEALYAPDPADPGKMSTRWGGFLERIDQFDPQFFHISPREAAYLDPQQRLLLEVAWEALEDGGQAPARLAGSATGVFVGISTGDYGAARFQDPVLMSEPHAVLGGAFSIAANRLSYVFDFRGPSLAVDTACSSSLVAVHLACESLARGECDLALAGGVNAILSPGLTINFSKAGFMAPDGRCKAFDAAANGYVRGEGVGVVVLKPLARALADGDPIYAVIRGSAINQDGRSNGLTAPNRFSQEAVLRAAYSRAGVSPGRVVYVEAHGTGTALGDPIEARALGTVLAEDRPPGQPCAIGAVKTNIGHLEAAAGIAGLIKVALSLKHDLIPPSLHFREPSPYIPFDSLRLRVQRELGHWPAEARPVVAGVSSFGFGGTNVHVVLEAAPPGPAVDGDTAGEVQSRDGQTSAYLVPFSARTPAALEDLTRAYERWLAADQGADGQPARLADLAYTAALRRDHHEHRLALVARSTLELRERLQTFLDGESGPGLSVGRAASGRRPKVVFVFPGQGSQWDDRARELVRQEPVFREALERCEQAMRPHVDWSLLEVLTGEDGTPPEQDRIDVIQPSLFAIQVALAALWRAWGVEPDAVIGHSMGEAAAACVAGALSLEDAARIICRRSRLLRRVSGQGRMAAVELSLDQSLEAIADCADRVAVAASNGPRSTVLSGDPEALEAVLASLEARDVFCRWVNVDVASHSPQVDPLRADLLRELEGLSPRTGAVRLHSTVTGQVVEGPELGAEYWVRNLREPVLFAPTVERLLDDGFGVFVELSPQPLLTVALQQSFEHRGRDAAALPSLRRGEQARATLLGSLGALHTRGYPVAWERLYPSGRCVRLPAYPWQHARYWVEPATSLDGLARSSRGAPAGDLLLGRRLDLAQPSDNLTWEGELSCRRLPYLADHQVQGAVVLPGTAFVALALAAAREAFGSASCSLADLRIEQPLLLSADGRRRVQVVLTPGAESAFRVYSRPDEAGGSWALHASGRIGPAPSGEPTAEPTLATARAACGDELAGPELYRTLGERGLRYGPSFQGLQWLWRGQDEALGEVRAPAEVEADLAAYPFHPALLDAAGHVLLSALPADGRVYVPTRVDRVRFFGPPAGPRLWSYARFRLNTPGSVARSRGGPSTSSGRTVETSVRPELVEGLTPEGLGEDDGQVALSGDLRVMDEDGRVLLEAEGVQLRSLEPDGRRALPTGVDAWLYELRWVPASLVEVRPAPAASPATWLVFADSGGIGRALAAQLEQRGDRAILVTPGEAYARLGDDAFQLDPERPEQFRELLRAASDADPRPCRGIVHLWSLDASPLDERSVEAVDRAQALGCLSVLSLVQALAATDREEVPRLWLVTGGAQAVATEVGPVSVVQAPIWGLGGTIVHEFPPLRCTRVDLGWPPTPPEARALAAELWSDDGEDQVALRGEARYVARLTRYQPPPGAAERIAAAEASAASDGPGTRGKLARSQGGPSTSSGRTEVPPARPELVEGLTPEGPDLPRRLETTAPGVLENLAWRPASRRAPGPGEVEIEVEAAGLNFQDVLAAMGLWRDPSGGPLQLGSECAGRIIAVGEGVEGLQVGDDVVAIASSSLSTFVTASAAYVLPRPRGLSAEQAATIPIAFLTAHYALNRLARLAQGERVLIHAASGGVGLAAIQLARRAGAEVFATAGSPEKRAYLESLGVRHVMDSRSLAFADQVLAATGGQGVDVVLNSLTGEAAQRSLSVLRSYGRFLEIGKRDIYQNAQLGLGPFRKNLSYFAVDLSRVLPERPDLGRRLFQEIMALVEAGDLTPLPATAFPGAEAPAAFRYMAQARHIGKVVLLPEDQRSPSAAAGPAPTIRSDATYLVTGGLGGLGLTVAQWMVEQGARSLVLVGRRGPSETARQALSAMEQAGARVTVATADVADADQVAALLAHIDQELPPLRGIVHAAGVLDDAILLQLDPQRFDGVMAPKVRGAWHLHRLTQDAPLDFFVLFSSAASVLGSPGQGNYAAANAFLDALAWQRRAEGRPGLSINWGPWEQVGLAARPDRAGRLALRGLASITPEHGARTLAHLLAYDPTQVLVLPPDVGRWARSEPTLATAPLLAELVAEQDGAGERRADSSLRESLLAVGLDQRRPLVEAYLQEQIARVLGLPVSEVESDRPLETFGFDSLMTVELGNRLRASLGLTVRAAEVWQHPSVAELAGYLAERLDRPDDALETGRQPEAEAELRPA